MRTRSGLAETWHDGAVAIFDSDRELVASSGDIDRPFYLRSSAKPFQAYVAQGSGAALAPIEMALAAASHDGDPVHVAIVRSMLEEAGLSQDDLQCPMDWPLGRSARHRLLRAGHNQPRRIWHNCSGKHASWLRACQARGWPIDTYLDPGHPLQVAIQEFVSDLGGYPVQPVGVDGCGAPVLRTTTRAMARMFSSLATDDMFSDVVMAMHRYPALVSGSENGDARIAISVDAVAKRGAAGCIGVAVRRQWGLAVKAWDGSDEVASLAAVAALDAIGALSDTGRSYLADTSQPPVLGGDVRVGSLEPCLQLQHA